MIYLDNAATTLKKPPEVIDAVVAALCSMGNAARGAYDNSLQASRTVYGTREKLAKLFGCQRADHVVFTANSTEALNIAIQGGIKPNSHVISTDLEHNSVLRPLYRLQQERSVSLSFLLANAKGAVDTEAFEPLIRPETSAIVCTHASNLTGNLIDLSRVGRIARSHNLLFIVDASQTAGAIPINMQEMGIDVLCFTGHKGLMGPQGTGGLCIREGVALSPWKVGGTGVQSYSKAQPIEYPTRLEAGTLNSHGIAGLSAALDFIDRHGVDVIGQHEQNLMWRFYEGIRSVDGVRVYGDFTHHLRAAIVSLNIRDYDSGDIADILSEEYGIAVRPGAHCAPRMHQTFHTEKQGAVRFSFSWYNTEDEVDAAVNAIKALAD